MTERTRDDQLDRQLREFLAWQADELYDAARATEVATRISSRVGTRRVGLQLAPQLLWVLLAALLAAALIGAAVIGANLLRTVPPAASSYEAVFLRLEVVAGSPIVHVVGVNPEDRVRAIARLDGAWITYGISTATSPAYPAPVGAVSPSGLLAIPSSSIDLMMHWEIFDLRRPKTEPVVLAGMGQHVELLRETPYWEFNTRGGGLLGSGRAPRFADRPAADLRRRAHRRSDPRGCPWRPGRPPVLGLRWIGRVRDPRLVRRPARDHS